MPQWIWVSFGATLLILLALDLFSHRGGREATRGWAVTWSVIWIGAGLAFTVFVWIALGAHEANEYLAAYLIEKSLSLDNMFVFLVIFNTLDIPKENQRTALTWGIFGALVFRALFIFVGSAALERWDWVNYVFGAILMAAAIHTFREDPSERKESRLVLWLSEHSVSRDVHSRHLVVKQTASGRRLRFWCQSSGLEMIDVLFAVDSYRRPLPLRNEFLIYSSNAFAILGLRSLYIVIAQLISGLRFLHYGLAAILAFAALKITLSEWMHMHPLLSVAIIIVIVGSSVLASLLLKTDEGTGSL